MTLKPLPAIPDDRLCRITVLNRQRLCKIDRKSVALFCTALLRSLSVPDSTLTIVLVRAREMRSINYRYLGRNYATDVLSFSYGKLKMEGVPFLGEIVIAPEIAANQAVRNKISPDKELRKLLVHGIVHLLGYDHETDRGQMNRLQTNLLRRKFFLNSPSLMQSKAT
jgi:probable rRNA maturation factor